MNKFIPTLLGTRYYTLKTIEDRGRFITIFSICTLGIIIFSAMGIESLQRDLIKSIFLGSFVLYCIATNIILRTRVAIKTVPVGIIILAGIFFVYMLYQGQSAGWTGAWIVTYPILSISFCGLVFGLITSGILLASLVFLFFSPWYLGFYNIGTSTLATQFRTHDSVVVSRLAFLYILVLLLTAIYEIIRIRQNNEEALLNKKISYERDYIQKMKDNMNLGVFMMDKNLLIQPQYSQQLSMILSRYDEDLKDKNFLDLLSASLNTKQQKILYGYFTMMFEKSRSLEVLAEANPLQDFEYKIDNRTKFLSAKFQLIEQGKEESYILGVIEDITRQKELSNEIALKQQEQEIEMKNLFDVLQISPVVFEDFIDTVNDHFKEINAVLKNETLSEREVVTKFFQNIHAIKSNAAILGLDNFSKKLHVFETEIKGILNKNEIDQNDVFHLTFEFETLMKEQDEYRKMTDKLQKYKSENSIDNVLKAQLEQACKKTAIELQKEASIELETLSQEILETELRKPIKDILLQFIRNSIHHGFASHGKIKISLEKEGSSAVLTYSDNGSGIDFNKLKEKYQKEYPNTNPSMKDLTAYMFKPDVSTSSTVDMSGGRGIGLSFVKDLIAKHGGKITLGLKDGLSYKIVFPLE
jgi:signal transduction histidine kinase